jgi:hypothetical protein
MKEQNDVQRGEKVNECKQKKDSEQTLRKNQTKNVKNVNFYSDFLPTFY